MPPLINESDVRAMVRLVSEVAALQADHAASKRFLMNGLKEMIGADCWVWMLSYLAANVPPVYVSILHEGFDEDRFARYLLAIEHPDMQDLTAPFAEAVLGSSGQVTRLRQQIDTAGRFPHTNAYALWQAADIAPLVISARMLDGHPCMSAIALYRRADQPLFDERESRIAHIILTEVPWLHSAGWPEDLGCKPPQLSRKPRLVLNLLLEGHSRKRIASQLNLSIHTISDYVKDVYANFGVQSQAELMRRFTVGNSQDT